MAGNGYIRQSIADIVAGNTVEAQPLNDEFNSLNAAFNGTTGHCHDGSQGNGAPIPLATGTTGTLQLTKLPTEIQTYGNNNLTAAELQQLQNINTVTITNTQWGYIGAFNQGLTTTSDVTFNNVTVSGTLTASLGDLDNLTTAEITQLTNINTVTIDNTQWGYLGSLNQGLATTSSVTFANVTVTGTLTASLGDLDNLTTAEINQLENINATTISTTQWGYLGSQNQAVSTTSSVTFNALAIGSNAPSDTQWGYLAALDQGLTTTSDVTFNNLTINGDAFFDEGTRENLTALGSTSGNVTLDCATRKYFSMTATGAVNLTFSNINTGDTILVSITDASTVTITNTHQFLGITPTYQTGKNMLIVTNDGSGTLIAVAAGPV